MTELSRDRKKFLEQKVSDEAKYVILNGLGPMFQAIHKELRDRRRLTILVYPNRGSYKMKTLSGEILKGGFKTCESYEPKLLQNRVVEVSREFNIEGHRPDKLDGPYRFDIRLD